MFNAIKTITATKKVLNIIYQRLDIQTNNISISICFGFQNFSEKQNKL